MILFISGAELVFVFFIVLLVFGADKIPSIAKGLAKGMTQIKQATNEIKTEISKNTDVKNPTESLTKDLKDSVVQPKEYTFTFFYKYKVIKNILYYNKGY